MARVKLRCIMKCPRLKSSYREKGLLQSLRRTSFVHGCLVAFQKDLYIHLGIQTVEIIVHVGLYEPFLKKLRKYIVQYKKMWSRALFCLPELPLYGPCYTHAVSRFTRVVLCFTHVVSCCVVSYSCCVVLSRAVLVLRCVGSCCYSCCLLLCRILLVLSCVVSCSLVLLLV